MALFCRFCLQESYIYTRFKSDLEDSKKVLTNLYLCTQIDLKIQTSLYIVCNHCLNYIDNAIEYRKKCLEAQETLRNCNKFEGYSSITNDTESGRDQKKEYDLNDCIKTECITGETVKVEFNGHDTKQETICEDFLQVSNTLSDSCCEEQLNHNNTETIEKVQALSKKTYKCEICSKVLKTRVSLKNHKVSMHENRKHIASGYGSTRRYHCRECDYSSPHSQAVVNHSRRHSGERPYACHCGKRFTQSGSLTIHQKSHSNIAQFTCTVCGKPFKLSKSLKLHMRVHEIGQYPCHKCQKRLKSKETLSQHMKRHDEIRNYSCEQCGSAFVTSSELINHKLKHEKVKPMQCNFCSYETNRKKSLILHLQRHSGIKTVKCNLCEAGFYSTSDLQQHMVVHTRVKKYQCPVCETRFAHSSSVNKHVRNVHGKLNIKSD